MEKIPVTSLKISQSALNALQRVGIRTVGQVLNNWDRLTDLPPKVDGKETKGKAGLGVTKAREIRAAVFALLCRDAKVTLGMDLEGCE